MPAHPAPRIADCFADLVDPRVNRTKHHQLLDIVTIALCAVISGAESWVEVEAWGQIKEAWLTDWLGLTHGIPSHDTFGRVFGRIDPAQFETGFLRWVEAVAVYAPQEVIASIGLVIGGMVHPVLPWIEPDEPPPPTGTILPGVFTYQQQRSLSCEYASVAIATTMIGRPVSEYEIERVVPLSENPHDGYRGDIEGEWGNTDDYGVYNEPLAEALPHFELRGEAIYGGRDDLTRELDLGRPTVVWLAMRGDDGSFDAWTDDGLRYQLTTWMHVMLAYGYDETGVYLTDPGTAVLRHYDWPTFMAMWEVMDGMALSVHE